MRKSIDLVIDGVDEIDPNFNAIKGGGGAHFARVGSFASQRSYLDYGRK